MKKGKSENLGRRNPKIGDSSNKDGNQERESNTATIGIDDEEEEEGQEGRLLQRYLEDQLDLVVRSVYYDCVNDGDDELSYVVDVGVGNEEEFFDQSSTPLLS
ncbi:hypothetical protein BVC80_8551g6 [Macleaya cordata]|uniref:Uncharacterized protein n=1 Tax=Macleaya cordata TaxID=56857 RepID=A0A200QV90_MACCD|nr:hypothetical protein BVC80_8551g6 [Macleaya cordata]